MKSLISAPRISISTRPIFTKFRYFMLYISMILHTKFQRIRLVVYKICTPENCPIILVFSSFFRALISFKFGTPIQGIRAYKFGGIPSNLSELCMTIS